MPYRSLKTALQLLKVRHVDDIGSQALMQIFYQKFVSGFQKICSLSTIFRAAILFIGLIFLFSNLFASTALALSKEQKRLYDKGVYYYDLGCDSLGQQSSTSQASGDLQELAKQMLENDKIAYGAFPPDRPAADWQSRVPDGGNKNSIDTKDVVRALADGQKAYTTAGNASNKEADLNPNILKFILEVAKTDKITINALTDKTHGNGSEHYKGLAIDLEDGSASAPLSILNPAAKKFGGTKNGETGHHHYDFPNRPPASQNIPTPSTENTTTGYEYIARGDIPKSGLKVVSTYFGGSWHDNSWYIENQYQVGLINSGKKKASDYDARVGNPGDDNGLDSYGGNSDNKTVYAEIMGGTSLGGLPKGTKLEISYKGKKIIAEKNQVGGGAPGARLDLWWEAARLLDFKSGKDTVEIHVVPDNTPVTPVDGSGTENQVNNAAATDCACPENNDNSEASGALGGLVGEDNAEKAFNFFLGKGLSAVQAAALVGNLDAESGINSKRVQSGSDSEEMPAGRGYGIAQWTVSSRQNALKKHASKLSKPYYDLEVQLDFLWFELTTGYKNVLIKLKKKTDLREATVFIRSDFEAPSIHRDEERYASAKKYFDKYGDNVGSSSTSESAAGASCACKDASTSGSGVVVLDPGHGPTSVTKNDPESGLRWVGDGGGYGGEAKDMWEAAQKAKKGLEESGYKVILTKDRYDKVATLIDRYKLADRVNADIAISLHGDTGLPHTGEIYVQKNGLYRGSGNNKVVFNNTKLAEQSQKYAEAIKSGREKVEGSDIVIKDNSFDGRGGVEPGNIPIMMLLSKKTPWVYNEKKMPGNLDKYAEGIIEGTKKALGSSGAQSSQSQNNCPSGENGDAAQKAMEYAWPEYHPPNYFKMKPEYEKAVRRAQADGRYVGGGEHPGIDCGGFVTTVMHDSGADKDYNNLKQQEGHVGIQREYLDAHPEKYEKVGRVSNTSELKPGDIAIKYNNQHTYMYVGPISEHPDFKGIAASASYSSTGSSWRTPMADDASDFKDYDWYRLKR